MTDQEEQGRIVRRILVALDTSPASLAALEAAVELAARSGAELVGLFVEDINLVRLSGSTVTHEIGLFSARSRRLDMVNIERQLRTQASRARQALVALAEPAQVTWSFRVTRGVVAAELLTAAREADLVILGRASWSPRSRRRLGSTARTILTQTPGLALLLQHGIRLGLPILVAYDGSTAAKKALRATGQLMQNNQGLVTVLLLAEGPAAAERLQQAAAAELEQQSLEVHYLWQPRTDILNWLVHAVRAVGCRLLILPVDGSFLDPEGAVELLNRVQCPVLLVR